MFIKGYWLCGSNDKKKDLEANLRYQNMVTLNETLGLIRFAFAPLKF